MAKFNDKKDKYAFLSKKEFDRIGSKSLKQIDFEIDHRLLVPVLALVKPLPDNCLLIMAWRLLDVLEG